MYNNASYRQCSVIGINQPFSFNFVGNTLREQPAIKAWTGATVNDQIEPDHGKRWYLVHGLQSDRTHRWRVAL